MAPHRLGELFFIHPLKPKVKMERQDLTRCAARAVREMADAATLKAVAEAECFRTKERFCRRNLFGLPADLEGVSPTP